MRPITLSVNAAKHIQEELNKSGQHGDAIVGLKLGIKKSGCSGYSYVLDWVKADTNNIEDFHVFDSHDIKIYVDNDSYQYIAGTELDYIQQGISRVMIFRNPNATAECGCGESFTVDNDKA